MPKGLQADILANDLSLLLQHFRLKKCSYFEISCQIGSMPKMSL